MTFISNIKELKGFLKKGPAKNKSRIEAVIQLYEAKKIPNFKTALNMVLSLTFPSIYNPAKTDVQYQKLTSKYSNAIPITSRLDRERDALHGVSVFKDDLKKVRAGIALTFNKHNDGKTKSFRELMAMHRPRMLTAIQEALETKKSMKIKLRVDITYKKIVEGFDGEKEEQTLQAPISTNNAVTVTSGNMKQVLHKLIDELSTKSETLEQVDKDGKPIGSGWAIVKFDKLSIDIFETKALRASSYIPTPEKYCKSMCGLVNIQNDDELCFQWCLRYHQSAKGHHDSRLSKLKKISDKYNYDGVEFPASYEAISAFEGNNSVCIFIYELDSEDQIRLGGEVTLRI